MCRYIYISLLFSSAPAQVHEDIYTHAHRPWKADNALAETVADCIYITGGSAPDLGAQHGSLGAAAGLKLRAHRRSGCGAPDTESRFLRRPRCRPLCTQPHNAHAPSIQYEAHFISAGRGSMAYRSAVANMACLSVVAKLDFATMRE